MSRERIAVEVYVGPKAASRGDTIARVLQQCIIALLKEGAQVQTIHFNQEAAEYGGYEVRATAMRERVRRQGDD